MSWGLSRDYLWTRPQLDPARNFFNFFICEVPALVPRSPLKGIFISEEPVLVPRPSRVGLLLSKSTKDHPQPAPDGKTVVYQKASAASPYWVLFLKIPSSSPKTVPSGEMFHENT